MTDRPESRVRSVPVADVLTREGRDDPAVRRRADRPRRVLKTAAGAAVVVGALWGLHDQFAPDHTGVSAEPGRSTPFTETPVPPTTVAATEVVGPRVATGEVVTAPTTAAAPPVEREAPARQAQPERTAQAADTEPRRTRSIVPNPVQILLDAARLLGGR